MTRIRTFARLVPACFAVLLLAACDSTPRREESDEVKPEERTADSGSVIVPKRCLERLGEFTNRSQLLLADQIVIDASSDPFFTAVTTAGDPRTVEKTEGVDAANKVSVVRLRNKTDQTNLESVLPQVRVGDGLRVVATREIVLRFHNRVSPRRPVYCSIQAKGNVLYYDSHAPEKVRRDGDAGSLSIRLSVDKERKGYLFHARIR